jgi:aminopeptidase N
MTQARQSFSFKGLATRPVASILRGFSAPVILSHPEGEAQRGFLLAHDTDPFNRWEAGRALARAALSDMILKGAPPDTAFLAGMAAVLRDDSVDPATRALMLGLPSQSDMATSLHDTGHVPDPQAIWAASETMKQAISQYNQDLLPRLYSEMHIDAPYSPDADQVGKRALQGAVLALMSRLDGGAQAARQFESADNMTQQLSALACLLNSGKGIAETQAFYDQWKHDRLVIDKWFSLQIIQSAPHQTVEITKNLTKHADFNWKNPNRFRATLGALSMHHAGFHQQDGSGYALLADWLIKLDAVNPQTTARMTSAFQTWRRYDSKRQDHVRAQLDRIAATPDLSRDTHEMISRIRGA